MHTRACFCRVPSCLRKGARMISVLLLTRLTGVGGALVMVTSFAFAMLIRLCAGTDQGETDAATIKTPKDMNRTPQGDTHDVEFVRCRQQQLVGVHSPTLRVRSSHRMIQRLPPEVRFRMHACLPSALRLVSEDTTRVVAIFYRMTNIVRIWNAARQTERTAVYRIHEFMTSSVFENHFLSPNGRRTFRQICGESVICILLDWLSPSPCVFSSSCDKRFSVAQ